MRFQLILVLLLFVFCEQSQAQTGIWRKKLNDKSISAAKKVYYSDSLLLGYRRSNPDSALFFAKKVLKYAIEAKDTGSVDYALMHLGSLHRIKGNLDSAILYYQRVLRSYRFRNFEDGIASVYNNMATVYKTQGKYSMAIKNYFEALDMLKHSKRYNAVANLYSNFAGLYYHLENYDRALEQYEKAIQYFHKEKDQHEITHVYRGMARIYIKKGEYNKAEMEAKTALALDKKNRITVFIPENLLLLMQVYSFTNNKNEFEKTMEEVRPYLAGFDLAHSKSTYFELCGDFQVSQQNLKNAQVNYDSSLFYANVENLPEVKLNLLKKVLGIKLALGKNGKELIAGWNEIENLEKVVLKARQDRITQETEARYNLRDKEELITALHQRNKASQEAAQKERELKQQSKRQNLYLWIGIGVVCLFFVYVLFINKKLRSTQKELKQTIVQKDFLFKELNHRVKNNLHIVSSFLGIEMHGKSQDVQEILRTCENRIHSLGLVHEMLYQSEKIEAVELKPYFGKLCASISSTLAAHTTSIGIDVQENIWLSSDKAILVGLIVNELLTNAIKYAGNNLTLNVVAKATQAQVHIWVNDNGKGLSADFDPKKSQSRGMKLAFGLSQQLNGHLSWQNLDPGTSFQLIVPAGLPQ